MASIHSTPAKTRVKDFLVDNPKNLDFLFKIRHDTTSRDPIFQPMEESPMDGKIVFFKRYMDTGEIQIASITKEDLKHFYGHTELRNGMLLEQEDARGNPATEVIEILEEDLAYKWETIENLELVFLGTEPFLVNFINELLAKVHTFYPINHDDLALARRIKTGH